MHNIVDCIVLPIVNEGAKISAENIAKRASDIDLVEVHGYGFPRRMAGPMHWAEGLGLSRIVEALNAMAAQGMAEVPVPFLVEAADKRGFPKLK